jgi:hypothetical protein
MAPRKRKLPTANGPDKAPKRSRKSPSPTGSEVIVLEDDEEDLDAILAHIKEQEESEQLARRLQEEWNGTSSVEDPIVVDGNMENDEALARKLAQEWTEDGGDQPSGSKRRQRRELKDDDVGEYIAKENNSVF